MDGDDRREVAGRCLCFRAQRLARVLARRFDAAFRPFGLTNGQFSLLMALNGPEPVTLGRIAPFLGMDRTTLTAALKLLRQRGLVAVSAGREDRRERHLALTEKGRATLRAALPVWRGEHERLDAALAVLGEDPDALRAMLDAAARA